MHFTFLTWLPFRIFSCFIRLSCTSWNFYFYFAFHIGQMLQVQSVLFFVFYVQMFYFSFWLWRLSKAIFTPAGIVFVGPLIILHLVVFAHFKMSQIRSELMNNSEGFKFENILNFNISNARVNSKFLSPDKVCSCTCWVRICRSQLRWWNILIFLSPSSSYLMLLTGLEMPRKNKIVYRKISN